MIIYYTAADSPLGRLYLGQHTEGLCILTLGDGAKEQLFTYVEKVFPQATLKSSKTELKDTIDQLTEYFRGDRTDFDLKLFLSGTAFQKQVWQGLLEIPYG